MEHFHPYYSLICKVIQCTPLQTLRRTYCPSCKKHTDHEVFQSKKRKASELKWGQRQFRRVTSGYRGYPRPLPSGNKPVKKLDLRYKCKECGKSHIKRNSFRVGKVDFVAR